MVKKNTEQEKFTCKSYPCFHIVIDKRRKIFKIFLEDFDEYIIPIPFKEIERLVSFINEYGLEHMREAVDDEIDYLARKYLGAEPKEFEEYE